MLSKPNPSRTHPLSFFQERGQGVRSAVVIYFFLCWQYHIQEEKCMASGLKLIPNSFKQSKRLSRI